ncbi:MAG: hypothetical protein JW953_09010 [Anaerolineae bacterium]|nr:hypothetical protein [Anaerolineae bacterium]
MDLEKLVKDIIKIQNEERYFCLPSIQFWLNTELKFFSQWLAEKTSNASAKQFPTEKGHIGLQKARLEQMVSGKNVIQLDGFYITLSKRDSDTEYAQPIGSVIEFVISMPSPTRLEVTAKCRQAVCLGYFVEMLAWIEQAYPESRGVVEQFFTKLSEIKGVEIRQTQGLAPTLEPKWKGWVNPDIHTQERNPSFIYRVTLKANLHDVIQLVNLWNKKYALHLKIAEEIDRGCAWEIDNVLIEVWRVIDEKTQIELNRYKKTTPTLEAITSWRKIISLFAEIGLIELGSVQSLSDSQVAQEMVIDEFVTYPLLKEWVENPISETEYKTELRNREPGITEGELNERWRAWCQLIDQFRKKVNERDELGRITSDEAALQFAAKFEDTEQIEQKAFLPIKQATIQKWKKAYSIVIETRTEYQNSYENLETETPIPKISDLLDALKAQGIQYSDRQLREIIKAGDAGQLK